MKTKSEYLLPKPGDPERSFPVYMPKSCEVYVYAPDDQHADWRVVAKIRAIDTKTDEFADFQTSWSTTHDPTREECAQVVVNMLAHEVQEQMGLTPHEAVIPKVGRRDSKLVRLAHAYREACVRVQAEWRTLLTQANDTYEGFKGKGGPYRAAMETARAAHTALIEHASGGVREVGE